MATPTIPTLPVSASDCRGLAARFIARAKALLGHNAACLESAAFGFDAAGQALTAGDVGAAREAFDRAHDHLSQVQSCGEPCGDETIVAKLMPDGSYADVRRYHAVRSRSGQNGGAN